MSVIWGLLLGVGGHDSVRGDALIAPVKITAMLRCTPWEPPAKEPLPQPCPTETRLRPVQLGTLKQETGKQQRTNAENQPNTATRPRKKTTQAWKLSQRNHPLRPTSKHRKPNPPTFFATPHPHNPPQMSLQNSRFQTGTLPSSPARNGRGSESRNSKMGCPISKWKPVSQHLRLAPPVFNFEPHPHHTQLARSRPRPLPGIPGDLRQPVELSPTEGGSVDSRRPRAQPEVRRSRVFGFPICGICR